MTDAFPPPDAFRFFCETAERIRATAKRLEKALFLGDYFRTLADEDLVRAARYFSGYVFSARDQRTIHIGGAALIAAVTAASGAEEALVRTRLVALGDIGDVAGELHGVTEAVPGPSSHLCLSEVESFLAALAVTTGTKQKILAVTKVLRGLSAPEAKYLVKLLQGDLRIGLKEGAVEDALARHYQVSVGEVQRANMLTGDIGETALLARQGTLSTAALRLFHPLKFMLATPATDLADLARQMPSDGFVVEDKFDGIRAQAHLAPVAADSPPLHGTEINGKRVALFSRTLDEITGAFPDLLPALAALIPETSHQGFILDGEILPVRPAAGKALPTDILPFQSLQPRLGRKTLTSELLARTPVAFVLYDALFSDGRILLEEPLNVRRAALVALVVDGQVIRRADSRVFVGTADLDQEFEAARARGNEGLMVKDPGSRYKPGRRGREWLKIKRTAATLDVVVTAAQVGEGRRSRFLSDYTFAVRTSETDPTLLNVGKAYSGLTDAEVQELSDWLMAHTVQEFAHGKVRTVEPSIVFEVTFDRVQPSARHKSGFALRFPRILRVRQDKPASEIDTLESVRRLAEADGAALD
ncbi:MAG: ATP-dependent DNA ligase [Cytophagales bacterium]|nr:ATP-dependent DNA ligase [Armatimonadota bacterium]